MVMMFQVYLQQKAIEYMNKNSKPGFIEFITYRRLEHCGSYYDFQQNRDLDQKRI